MHCKQLLILTLPLVLAIACSRDEPPTEPPAVDSTADSATEREAGTAQSGEDAGPAGDSSRTALDWAGTYSGVLPCASCPGIDTRITLDEDGDFERSSLYIDEDPDPKTETGRFSWNNAGSRITLESADGGLQQYLVGENSLIQLDRSGERVTGDHAGQYMLHKHINDPAIEGRRWRLVELRGQPVAAGENAQGATLTLRPEDAVAAGNASCNTFSGTYAIKSGQRISFGRNMAVTMKACPDMSVESALLEVLQQADNYSLGEDGTLSLNRARMAPLARFEEES
ncbi:MAG TPA: copper resistance protein NlpE N-terminal domain-containing protein [Woeseiaceae bacterium]|nr:copper resistance protein NlpE N-terminal domain-containing protein [Woeseiaceae bacterium]